MYVCGTFVILVISIYKYIELIIIALIQLIICECYYFISLIYLFISISETILFLDVAKQRQRVYY